MGLLVDSSFEGGLKRPSAVRLLVTLRDAPEAPSECARNRLWGVSALLGENPNRTLGFEG